MEEIKEDANDKNISSEFEHENDISVSDSSSENKVVSKSSSSDPSIERSALELLLQDK